MRLPESTKKQRTTQRINVASQVLASAASSLSQNAAIPFKITQSITSSYSFFTNNLNKSERAIQVIQAILSAAQAALMMTRAFTEEGEHCVCTMSNMCTISLVSELAYQGLLVGSYAISEARKEQIMQNNTSPEQEEKESPAPEPNY